MKIYLVAGRAGSGKGEIAKIIKEHYLSLKKKPIITEYSKAELQAVAERAMSFVTAREVEDYMREFIK